MNKANTSDTEVLVRIYIYLLIMSFSIKIYDKRENFDGNVPRRPSYGVNISKRIRFARV